MRSSASIFSQCSRSSRCSAELRKAFLPTFLSRSYCSGRWIGFIRFLRIWYTRSLCGSAASATCTVTDRSLGSMAQSMPACARRAFFRRPTTSALSQPETIAPPRSVAMRFNVLTGMSSDGEELTAAAMAQGSGALATAIPFCRLRPCARPAVRRRPIARCTGQCAPQALGRRRRARFARVCARLRRSLAAAGVLRRGATMHVLAACGAGGAVGGRPVARALPK